MGHCLTQEEIWVLLSLAPSPGLPSSLTASIPPWEPWGWGLGPKAPQPAYIKGGAAGGVRPAQVTGWGLSTNREASLSPAPVGQPFLSPVPSSPGWHLTFWGSEGRPPQEVPLGEGPAPRGPWERTGLLGEESAGILASAPGTGQSVYAHYLIWASTVPGDKDCFCLSFADKETEARGG